jgi:hypothetical protein
VGGGLGLGPTRCGLDDHFIVALLQHHGCARSSGYGDGTTLSRLRSRAFPGGSVRLRGWSSTARH